MPLKLRLRGQTWHLRGTIRVGKESFAVEESTGFDQRARADAESYRIRREHEVQQELLHGRAGRASRHTIDDAITRYLERPAVIARRDLRILKAVVKAIGDRKLDDATAAWSDYAARHLSGRRPATVRRVRGTLMAAINYFAQVEDVPVRRLPSVKRGKGEEIVAWLTAPERDRLLAAYTTHAQPIALFLCFQGARSQETMQLQWEQIDFVARTAFIAESKNHEARTVPLYPRVLEALRALHQARGQPGKGHVFLTRWGEPYKDTRAAGNAGSNPLRRVHDTACKRAGVSSFRVHDWRHHWAVSMFRAGVDIETVRKQGGWRDLSAMQRYLATAVDEHHHQAVARVK
jgi:integrase